MKWMLAVWSLCVSASVGTSLCLAQGGAAPASVTFVFDNPVLQPPHYTLTMHEDGSATYQAQPTAPDAPALSRSLTIVDPLRAQIFSIARKEHFFTLACEMKGKMAFTGNKTFSYSGPGGSGSCTFNFAHDHQLQDVSDQLIAVANTLEEGQKLALLLQHDKLGLDEGMALLGREQSDGRVLDLQNIAPLLHAIAEDTEVLNHTRNRATALLATLPAAPGSTTH